MVLNKLTLGGFLYAFIPFFIGTVYMQPNPMMILIIPIFWPLIYLNILSGLIVFILSGGFLSSTISITKYLVMVLSIIICTLIGFLISKLVMKSKKNPKTN